MDRSTIITAICVPAVFIFLAIKAGRARREAERLKQATGDSDAQRAAESRIHSRLWNAPPGPDGYPPPPLAPPPRYEVHKIIDPQGWTGFDVDVEYKDHFRIFEILPRDVMRLEHNSGEIVVHLQDARILYLIKRKYALAEVEKRLGKRAQKIRQARR